MPEDKSPQPKKHTHDDIPEFLCRQCHPELNQPKKESKQ